MDLGSFKALGGAYAIACEAEESGRATGSNPLAGKVYVAASAGNHGLSVAAGAQVFGARAVIYLSASVPEPFAERLKSFGAEVRREGAIYEESMNCAAKAAEANGWTLLSDSSWPGYVDIPLRIMEGYLQIMTELGEQVPNVPTHVFLQAGVGGMAGAVAAKARQLWGNDPAIVVVEPEAAPALMESIRAGEIVEATGPVSSMGRLDCKVPSLIALNGLARDADVFATISEEEAAEGLEKLAEHGWATTPSGAAGFAGILAAARSHRDALGIDETSRMLAILTEEPEGC